jgi:hypothetical protein
MRNVSEYDKLTMDELRHELVLATDMLVAQYNDLGARVSDYHRDYLMDYAHTPESSVAAKNRVAQHANMEAATKIIQVRATINGLTLCRDLLVFIMLSKEPGKLPFPTIAEEDSEGVATI